MATDDFSSKFQGLKITESQDINILLLGETGVGKSTFINAIANYLHYKTFKKASKADDLLILIPSVITVTNENFEQVTIRFGSDNNEYQEIGAAGTQDVKTYVFPIGEGKTRLRLIDSPGMGDPRGIEQDDINCENILSYLGQIKELHAICFLMKPTTTRRTVLFEYCVKQILSRLEKSASKNMVFIFTNTRGSDYGPGETLPCLKTVVDQIKAKPPHVNIPLRDNIFCLDNEAFRFLVALKNGITFTESIQQRFVESWNNSAKECWRLISYIVGDASCDGLSPHQLLNTISVNEARRIIVQLSQPLADISQLIHDNIRILERHKLNLKMDNQSLDELKKKLFIPVINLEVTKLIQPVTVCTSAKCADLVQVGEVKKWHYRQRCHDPCYLTNVTKEIVGDTNLMNCAAMNGTRTCMKCTCDFSVHMHVYYFTKTVNDKIEDATVKGNITMKEEALRQTRKLMDQIDKRKSELEQERNTVIKSTAQFAHFLQHNAISPYNDSYKAYIEYLISRERSLGRNGDPEVISNLEQLLYQYEQIKEVFDKSLKLNQEMGVSLTGGVELVTAQTVISTINSLYQLPHNGKKIKELLKTQKTARTFEFNKTCEYIHPKTSDLSSTETKKKKDDKNKKQDKKKDGQNTNNEGQHKRNYRPQQTRSFSQEQQVSRPPYRDPPPPYSDGRTYQQRPQQRRDNEPNVVVKVELGGSRKNQRGGSNQQGYGAQGPYYGGPPLQQGYYPPPPGPGQYPPQGQYYGPPQGQYNPPPAGPYYGPPYGYYQGPSQGQYYGPPQGSYQPPQGQHQGHYSRQEQPGYQKHYQGKQGQGYKNKRGGKRGASRPRAGKDAKSGTDKSGRSADSDSSD